MDLGLVSTWQCSTRNHDDAAEADAAGAPPVNMLTDGVGSNAWQSRHGHRPRASHPVPPRARTSRPVSRRRMHARAAPRVAPRPLVSYMRPSPLYAAVAPRTAARSWSPVHVVLIHSAADRMHARAVPGTAARSLVPRKGAPAPSLQPACVDRRQRGRGTHAVSGGFAWWGSC